MSIFKPRAGRKASKTASEARAARKTHNPASNPDPNNLANRLNDAGWRFAWSPTDSTGTGDLLVIDGPAAEVRWIREGLVGNQFSFCLGIIDFTALDAIVALGGLDSTADLMRLIKEGPQSAGSDEDEIEDEDDIDELTGELPWGSITGMTRH